MLNVGKILLLMGMEKRSKQRGTLPEGIVVGGNTPVSTNLLGWSVPRKRLISIVVGTVTGLMLIVAALVGLQQYNKRQSEKYVCSDKSGNGIASNIGAGLVYSQANVLKKTVAEIKKQTNYQKDPTCMYPIVEYYVYINDTNKARESYDVLQKIYDAKRLQRVYPNQPVKLTEIKKQIDDVAAQNKALLDSVIHIRAGLH